MAAAPARPRRALKLALGLLISGLFLYATFRTVSLRQVAELMGDTRPQWIAASLGFIALAYLLKIIRWMTMLRSLGASVRLRDAAPPFLGGVAFNNVLPFRAGDIIRVVAFQRFTGIAASGQIGTLALERLMDLLVLTSILFATISFWQVRVIDETLLAGLRLLAGGAAAAVLLFILAPAPVRLLISWVQARIPSVRGPAHALLRLVDAVATLSRPLLLVRIALLSILAWVAEGGAYYAVGQALGLAGNLQVALLALSIGTLATMIPSSPGYVGTFHYFAARVVSAFGFGATAATAYAVLIHALLWLSTTSSGFLALAFSGMERDVPQPKADHQ